LDRAQEEAEFREYLRKIRGRYSRTVGTIILLFSALLLILAFLTHYLPFEVMSIVCLLAGVIFIFRSTEQYIKTDTAVMTVLSSLNILADFIKDLKGDGDTVFIPSPFEEKPDKVYIYKGALKSSSNVISLKKDDLVKTGKLVPSPGGLFVKLYGEEIGKLQDVELDYLLEWLPRIMVSELQLAEKIEFTRVKDEVYMSMVSPVFGKVCQSKDVERVCSTIGCPISASVAESLVKTTKRVVRMKCRYDAESGNITAVFTLGSRVEKS
jgi:hypothetical protein